MNEQAFPSIEEIQGNYEKYWQTTLGMSKRFFAACMAMQGILASSSHESIMYSFEQVIPKLALMYADELLKQEDELK
jgi:hypothetical protein